MFVRFRAVGFRLHVDLVESRREGGRVRSERIGGLGSAALPEPISIAERVRFWRDLKPRFRALSNRVAADDRRKALAVIHERIPKPTDDEERQARDDAVRANKAFWTRIRDDARAQAKDKRKLIATVEKEVAAHDAQAAEADRALADPDKLAEPPLTDKETTRILRDAGITKQQAYRMRQLGALSEEEFEALLARRLGRRLG